MNISAWMIRRSNRFESFLIDRLVDKVPLGQFHGLRGEVPDGTAEAKRYAQLLERTHLISPFSELEKTVTWRLSIRRFVISTILKPSKWSNSTRSVEIKQVNDGAFAHSTKSPETPCH
jgi:hypothetical protein